MPNRTLSLTDFWKWLALHGNCILRAGTPQAVLYDDEDLHWHLTLEEPGVAVVQVVRGKRLMGEILISSDQISHVEASRGENEEEFIFELVAESDENRQSGYFFVLAHDYETEEPASLKRVH